jgi:hypothetical protein
VNVQDGSSIEFVVVDVSLHLHVPVTGAISAWGTQGGQEDDLGNYDNHEAKDGSKRDSNNLELEHYNALPGRLGEAGPGITNGGITPTTDNDGLDAAIERAVEGNDGVGLGGKERGLDTDENDISRNLNGNLEEESQDHDAPDATFATVKLGNFLAISAHSIECADATEGDDLRSSPEDDDGPPGGEESGLESRDSAVPSFLGLGRNDNVNPSGAELDTDKRAEQMGDNEGVRSDVVKCSVDECESESLESVHEDTAVHSTEATSGSKEAEGSTERRSNWLALAGNGNGSRRNAGRLGHVVVGGERLDGKRSVSGRLLIFDDGENGEDLFESVRAEDKDWDKEKEVGQKDVERPVRKLVNLMAKIWLGHVIAPHERHGRLGNHDEQLQEMI